DFLKMEENWLALARSLEASDRLTAFIGDAKISKDLGGVITSWNKGAEQMFGYSAEAIVGQPVTVLIPSDRLDEEYAILQHVRRGDQVDNFETVRRCKDGSLINVSLTISPIKGAEGKGRRCKDCHRHYSAKANRGPSYCSRSRGGTSR